MSNDMEGPRRSRRWIAYTAAGIVLLALVGVWIARRSSPPERSTSEPHSSSSMAGMVMADGGAARLTDAEIGQFGVTFGTVAERTLTSESRVAGTVTADETRVTQVAPRFGGFVEKLHVDFTGQAVRRGQPLLDLYSPEVLAAEQELIAARGLEGAIGEGGVPGVPAQKTNLVAAARRRLELWDVPQDEIARAQRTGVASRTVTLHAPASGIVTEKNVVRGQAIAAGQSLYTIVDLSTVWVDAALRESDAAIIRVGSGADVEAGGMAGHIVKGRVAWISPTLDSMSRTVRARITVANTDGALKPGMYATVRLHTPSRTVLAVPTSAVVRTGERAVVFVDMGKGELMPHEVALGATAGDFTEIRSGVDRGARVVTSAQYLLDSESNLGEVMRGMIGQGAMAPERR
ncbi:MAG TPA: efflux RND transporter periplasmic adaptor subunit [Gemmatimonadaceae bacterium]|nr:efflux RND transporter periplasmic adaptor subunit [Gemmatimonadaceae bacterium]